MSWSTLRSRGERKLHNPNLFRLRCDRRSKRSRWAWGLAVGLWRLRRGSRSQSQRRSNHCPYRVRYAWPEVARKLRPLGRGGITKSSNERRQRTFRRPPP
jgi:hypothetical protein